MKKLVKIISSNTYSLIEEANFNSNIHIDRSNSVAYWHICKELADYSYIRMRIGIVIENLGGFNNLRSDDDKDIALIYTKNIDIADAIIYYMNNGLTQDEATRKYLDLRSFDISNSAKAYSDRAYSHEVRASILMYLGRSAGEILLDNIRSFREDLKSDSVLGTNYGNSREGLLDFIESTASYEGAGLKSFFDLTNEIELAKYTLLLNSLMNLIYWGYNKL